MGNCLLSSRRWKGSIGGLLGGGPSGVLGLWALSNSTGVLGALRNPSAVMSNPQGSWDLGPRWTLGRDPEE